MVAAAPNAHTLLPQSLTKSPPSPAPIAVPANRINDAFTVAPTLDCSTIIALIAAQYPCGNCKSGLT